MVYILLQVTNEWVVRQVIILKWRRQCRNKNTTKISKIPRELGTHTYTTNSDPNVLRK